MTGKAEATARWPEGRRVHIIVPGKITAWNRPVEKQRKDGTRYRYTDRNSHNYASGVRRAAYQVMGEEDPAPNDTGFVLDVLGVWAVPSSWSGRRRERALAGLIRKTIEPDLDNGVIKGTMDALEGVVYSDDSDVIFTRSLKVYGTRPRLEIWVTVAPPMTEKDHPVLHETRTQRRLPDAPAMEQSRDLFA